MNWIINENQICLTNNPMVLKPQSNSIEYLIAKYGIKIKEDDKINLTKGNDNKSSRCKDVD